MRLPPPYIFSFRLNPTLAHRVQYARHYNVILLGGNPLLASDVLLAWQSHEAVRVRNSLLSARKYNLYRYAHTRTCVGAFCFEINLCFCNNPAKLPSLLRKLVAERRLNFYCKAVYARSRFAERNPTRAGSYMVQFLDWFFMLNRTMTHLYIAFSSIKVHNVKRLI